MKKLLDWPEYVEALATCDKVQQRLTQIEHQRLAIDGQLGNSEQESQKASIETAAEMFLETGKVRLATETEQKLRGDLKSLRIERRVLWEAQRIAHRRFQAARAKICVEITAAHKADWDRVL